MHNSGSRVDEQPVECCRSFYSCDIADKHVPFRKCQHWDSMQDWMALTDSLRRGFFLTAVSKAARRESESR